MIKFFLDGGALKLPLLILSFIIIILSIKKIVDLFIKKKLASAKLEDGLNAILFWGAISALISLFGIISSDPGYRRCTEESLTFDSCLGLCYFHFQNYLGTIKLYYFSDNLVPFTLATE